MSMMPIEQEGGGGILLEGGGALLAEGESEFANEMTQAFGELLDVQETVLGIRQKVTIGETQEIDAVIEAIPRDEAFIDGGVGERQTFRLMILAAALQRTEPPSIETPVVFTPVGSTIEVSLRVLSVESNNGIFHFIVGDPNTQT